ncbi:MAG: hypothetical protein L0219_20800 [Phycisphaerales bacterium]|nr:hypothetical protein [Phycisphaerales bacterium]
MRSETERITGLADRISQAMVEGGMTQLLTTRNMLAVLSLALVRYIRVATPSADRRYQTAAAEALLRHLGRGFLSISYDRATIAGLFGCRAPGENVPSNQYAASVTRTRSALER